MASVPRWCYDRITGTEKALASAKSNLRPSFGNAAVTTRGYAARVRSLDLGYGTAKRRHETRWLVKRILWSVGLIGVTLLGIVAAQGMMSTVSNAGMHSSVHAPNAQPIPVEDAVRRAEFYSVRYGAGVKLGDVMVFGENIYVQVLEARTGAGLTELLVDRYSGVVLPEPGPNHLWNTRFAPGRGMMGNGGMTTPTPRAAAPVRYAQTAAQRLAETFLSTYLPGAKVMEAQGFPGYYTFDYGRRDLEGMLSVNGYTGEVWVHTWHGPFVADAK
jgi:hypothetical protein